MHNSRAQLIQLFILDRQLVPQSAHRRLVSPYLNFETKAMPYLARLTNDGRYEVTLKITIPTKTCRTTYEYNARTPEPQSRFIWCILHIQFASLYLQCFLRNQNSIYWICFVSMSLISCWWLVEGFSAKSVLALPVNGLILFHESQRC